MELTDAQRDRLRARWYLFKAGNDPSARARVVLELRRQRKQRFYRWLDRTLQRELA